MSDPFGPEYLDFSGQGKNNARTLVDKIGAHSIRKAYHTLPDGRVVMAKTRGPAMIPEITLIKPTESPGKFYTFLAVPESNAAPWGFDTELAAMTYPDETAPASASLRISGGSLSVVRNVAWVTQAAHDGHQQHPGNARWSDDRVAPDEREVLSWWRPQSPANAIQDVAANIPDPRIGDGLLYRPTDSGASWYYDYTGNKCRQGQLYLDGVFLQSVGEVIYAAAMFYEGEVLHIRYLAPVYAIAPASSNYTPFFSGIRMRDLNTQTQVVTTVGGSFGFSYDSRAPRVPQFNASATKFVFESSDTTIGFLEVEWGAATGERLAERFAADPYFPVRTYGATPLSAESMNIVLCALDATGLPLTLAITDTIKQIREVWYEGDVVRALINVIPDVTVQGRASDQNTFSGTIQSESLELDGVTIAQTKRYIGSASWERSAAGIRDLREWVWGTGGALLIKRNDRGAMLAEIEKTVGESRTVRDRRWEGEITPVLTLDTTEVISQYTSSYPFVFFDLYGHVAHPLGGIGDDLADFGGLLAVEHVEFTLSEDRKSGIVSCTNLAGDVVFVRYLFNGVWKDATSVFSADAKTYLMAPIFV